MKTKHIETANTIYNLKNWAEGYFEISESGQLAVKSDNGSSIALTDIVEKVQQANGNLPVLLRFKQILRSRVLSLRQAFVNSLAGEDCQAEYLPVYPIKVNQQAGVVEEILGAGEENFRVGLEVGSKAELVAAIASCLKRYGATPEKATIICNGYKDQEYLRLALIAKGMGLQVYIVIEKLNELRQLLKVADEISITPMIGLRVRLSSIGKGNWQNSGGEKSKFGLTAIQLLSAVKLLQSKEALGSLSLLHFHLGSQLSNIHDIKNGLREAGRYYSELHAMGINIRWLDIGGGLGVDYEGSRSRSYCSMNYSMNEYAHNVVHTLKKLCDEKQLPFPGIITEAGRAMSAHHAVLVTQVVDNEAMADTPELQAEIKKVIHEGDIIHPVLDELAGLVKQISTANSFEQVELYHDICATFRELTQLYIHDNINLEQRAYGESLYQQGCVQLLESIGSGSRIKQEIIAELKEKTVDKMFLNFSVFRSLPDVWGIGQVFPIVPLARLDQPIKRRATLHDITCDSDGRIEDYINGENLEKTFPISSENQKTGALIGIFLVGAYQEILGDNHNLLAYTDSVDIDINAAGEMVMGKIKRGDTVSSVLHDVSYNANELQAQLGAGLERADIDDQLKQDFQNTLDGFMDAYTYLKL